MCIRSRLHPQNVGDMLRPAHRRDDYADGKVVNISCRFCAVSSATNLAVIEICRQRPTNYPLLSSKRHRLFSQAVSVVCRATDRRGCCRLCRVACLRVSEGRRSRNRGAGKEMLGSETAFADIVRSALELSSGVGIRTDTDKHDEIITYY